MKLRDRTWLDKPQTQKIIQILNNVEGQEARFVGGCVRNALLGANVADIDIATTMLADDVMTLLKRHEIKVIPTGIDHGTVTAIYKGEIFEITTLREDVSTDGRHAKVSFTNEWQKDASRRDFTMNALYMDARGEIFDFFEGIKDLENKHVRFIGEATQRIEEDYLRILRFFRFSSLYGEGDFDSIALKACEKLAEGIKTLSKERVHSEFFKILTAPYVVKALHLMRDHSVLKYVLPKFEISQTFKDFCEMEEEYFNQDNPLFRLYLLSKHENVTDLVSLFKLSNKNKKQLISWKSLEEASEKSLFYKLYYFGKETVLPMLVYSQDFDFFDQAQNWSEKPEFPLRATDLKAKGFTDGPQLGQVLKMTESWWVEQEGEPNHEEVLFYALNL